MKETKRQKQIGEIVRRHFGTVLFQEGSYIFGQALVTVTNVKMSPDMGIAKIYLSIYNTDNKQAVLLMMEENKYRLRQSLSQRIKNHVRRIPYIDFYLDEMVDEMYRVDALIQSIDIPSDTKEEE